MTEIILTNGKVSFQISFEESVRSIFQEFLSFISPYFYVVTNVQEIDFKINLKPYHLFSSKVSSDIVFDTIKKIRKSSAPEFDLTVEMFQNLESMYALDRQSDTAFFCLNNSTTMDIYISNNSFIHIIEFFRYYTLLLEFAKGTLILHSSAVICEKNKKVIAISGSKGAGKTSTMLNLIESSDLYSYYSGDKLLIDICDAKLRVRAWPDYPHIGIGSLKNHFELYAKLGLSEKFISAHGDKDKILFSPELFHYAVPKSNIVIGELACLLIPDITNSDRGISYLTLEQKTTFDDAHLYEDPNNFITSSWHTLRRPILSKKILQEHEKIKKSLVSEVSWYKTQGEISITNYPLLSKNATRIALIAPSGSGKTTAAKILTSIFKEMNICATQEKLSKPLYELQSVYLELLGIQHSADVQNQQLLENIASNIRSIDPEGLVKNLFNRLNCSDSNIIITDDLRDLRTDAIRLKEMGYIFVKMDCRDLIRVERLKKRNDLLSILHSDLDHEINSIIPDYIISNNSSIEELEKELRSFVTSIFGE